MKTASGITSRAHPLWLAFALHRLSGIALAVFLPAHFWILALAVTHPGRLDSLLAITEFKAIKLAEFGLVFLLAVHMFGGIAPYRNGMVALETTAKDLGGGCNCDLVHDCGPLFPQGHLEMRISDIDRHDTDILILGTGGAGLFAALHAQQSAPEGTKITIAVKGLIGKCGCTRMVQGGYNVALGGGDTVERHFMDTIVGGKWLPNQDMAWRLCEQAVVRIRELENEVGCFFDRNSDGSLHQKAFAGQTADRTVHKGDLTGIEIINRLMEKVLASGVEKLQEHRAVGLIPTEDGSAWPEFDD